jgi:hypothetical protein
MTLAAREAAALLRSAAACDSLRPAAMLEIAAFAHGSKPSLRFVVSRRDAALLLEVSRAQGLATCSRRVFLSAASGTWSEIVSHRTETAAELVVIDRDNATRILRAELSNSTEAGLLLGYPECCVRSLPNLARAAAKWPFALLSCTDARVDARLNRFAAEWGGIGLIGELFPCSLNCPAATSYSQSLYDAACTLGLVKLAASARTDALERVYIDANGSISRTSSDSAATVEFFW